MNYKKNYDVLIQHALKKVERCERPSSRSAYLKNKTLYGYIEFHHIVPKSFGGSNDESNLIPFTAREHFLTHYLLCKITENDKDKHYKMLNAFNRMAKCGVYNSKMYEYCRIELAKSRGERFSRGKSPSAKKVINLKTLEVFNCVKDACNWCGSNKVGACANGGRKHAGKHPKTGEQLSWKFS